MVTKPDREPGNSYRDRIERMIADNAVEPVRDLKELALPGFWESDKEVEAALPHDAVEVFGLDIGHFREGFVEALTGASLCTLFEICLGHQGCELFGGG